MGEMTRIIPRNYNVIMFHLGQIRLFGKICYLIETNNYDLMDFLGDGKTANHNKIVYE